MNPLNSRKKQLKVFETDVEHCSHIKVPLTFQVYSLVQIRIAHPDIYFLRNVYYQDILITAPLHSLILSQNEIVLFRSRCIADRLELKREWLPKKHGKHI